jgi:hypothetical protein
VKRTFLITALLATVVLSGRSVHAAGIAIEHTALGCVPVDRYAVVTARAAGNAPVAGAQLQFRVAPAAEWYSIRMTADDGGGWVGYLPRPTRKLPALEYRIVMTGADATSAATEPARVRVADPAECTSAALASLVAPIIVVLPAGAPVVPPVPGGMSPAGVRAFEGPPPSHKGRKIAGVVAGVAVIGATAAAVGGASSEREPTEPDLPGFRFNGTSPTPGSVLSPNGAPLVILMVMDRQPEIPLPIVWFVLLHSDAQGRDCLTMSGRQNVGPGPLEVPLTGPLFATSGGGCGARFQIDSVQIFIGLHDVLLYSETHALPFIFER